MSTDAVKKDLFRSLAKVAQALASGNRLQLLELMAQGERSVEALADLTGMSMANASQHLQALRQAGLVAAGHVPGAVNVPIDRLESGLSKLSKQREVVAYCRGPYCLMSFEAVLKFRKRGWKARRLQDGFPEWKAAGLPVD